MLDVGLQVFFARKRPPAGDAFKHVRACLQAIKAAGLLFPYKKVTL